MTWLRCTALRPADSTSRYAGTRRAFLPTSYRADERGVANLMSQFATSSWGGGAAGASGHSHSPNTARSWLPLSSTAPRCPDDDLTIYVVGAFVQLRELLASNRQLAEKFSELERKVCSHDENVIRVRSGRGKEERQFRRSFRPPVTRASGVKRHRRRAAAHHLRLRAFSTRFHTSRSI